MRVRIRPLLLVLAIGAAAPLFVACSDDGPTQPVVQNPATITVNNQLMGPVLFFRVKACGTADWGQDLLPADPVEGTIQPGTSKEFTVEAGCYDMQAQHLESPDPGPLVKKEIFNNVVTESQGFTWDLMEDPDQPA